MKIFLRSLPLVFVAASCVTSPETTLPGIGFTTFERDELSREFGASVQETWTASLDALTALDYPRPTKKLLGANEGEIEVDGLRLEIERNLDGGSILRVGVGMYASRDEKRDALLILEETARALDDEAQLRDWSRKVQELSETE